MALSSKGTYFVMETALFLKCIPTKASGEGQNRFQSYAELDQFFFSSVLGLELRVFTLSHSTSPIFVKGFSR
jgi:hypothetical protein